MYPGTIIEYEDQSDTTSLPIASLRNRPLFGAIFTSDKGTEEWTRVYGADFFDMYGKNISFARHGQPLLQAAMTVNAGAELYCKRLVADDATLANIAIIATITNNETQAKNADGQLLYQDEDGNETTEVTEKPIMETSKVVEYSLKSAENALSLDDAVDTIKESLVEGEYLLYVIADNGRGVSNKRIKIVPDYRMSKSLTYVMYNLTIMESDIALESMTFSVNPSLIINDQNISLSSMVKNNSKQIRCSDNPDGINAFVAALAEATGMTSAEMYQFDPLFGFTNRGVAIPGITVSDQGIDLSYAYGQMLQNGTNGAFGDAPINNEEEFVKQASAALNGTFDTSIFNVDQNKLDCWVDANYPKQTKRDIEALVTFREDFMYFRDQGLGQTSIDLIDAVAFDETKSMFCATYFQSYEVIDPYTKRQIPVTIGYDLAQKLVNHLDNGRILPPAGIKYGMTIDNCIYGTLSFAPTICPGTDGNQKEQLDDLRVNYASYIDNQLVLESLYTSQERNSQWSYINNVMGIQEIVRAIRTRCPASRYSFIDGENLERYKAEIDEILDPYRSNFKTLELEYRADPVYSVNKIFYAVLKVMYRDFVQTEWFKVVALATQYVES